MSRNPSRCPRHRQGVALIGLEGGQHFFGQRHAQRIADLNDLQRMVHVECSNSCYNTIAGWPRSCKGGLFGAMVSLRPSSSGLQTIWHDSREFGSTASAMSDQFVGEARRRVSRTSPRRRRHRDRWRRRPPNRPRGRSSASRRISITLQSLPRALRARASCRCGRWRRSSCHPQLLLQTRQQHGVLEAQLLVRPADVEGGLRHQGRFVKAARISFSLPG